MTHRIELWGKQRGLPRPYPLVLHLLDTASAATALWDAWLRPGLQRLIQSEFGPEARRWVGYFAGVHDIGKANPYFQLRPGDRDAWLIEQRQLLNPIYGATGDAQLAGLRRHEDISALHFASDTKRDNRAVQEGQNSLALVAQAHHGYFKRFDRQTKRAFDKCASGPWGEARRELDATLRSALCLPSQGTPSAGPVVTVLLAGLTVLADRLASMTHSVLAGQDDMAKTEVNLTEPETWVGERYKHFTKLVAAELGIYRAFENAHEAIFKPDVTLRPLQNRAQHVGDGLWLAMAPTGSGKTEAALLRHASKSERLIFLLPTQATTNAMMTRIQHAYRATTNAAALVHGMASLEDFYRIPIRQNDEKDAGGLFPSKFVSTRSARLFAPVSVATIDQALMASLPLKWSHLRLLALANAHVVVDEAHTLDQYQTQLLRGLLHWLGRTGTRVSILSATLPSWQRDAFAKEYAPSVELPPVFFPSSHEVGQPSIALQSPEYQIDLVKIEADDTAQSHIDWLAEQRGHAPRARLGVICNVVARAQQVAQMALHLGHNVTLLHSQMTAEHRRQSAEALRDLLGPDGEGTAMTVIGTQAIEASLNIDMDALSTDLAPAPSLIQRAGRVWRFSDNRRHDRLPGVVNLPLRIVRGRASGWALPYFESELERTWDHLDQRTMLHVPDDVQDFVESATLSLDAALDLPEQMEELAARALASQKGSFRARGIYDAIHPDARVGDMAALTQTDIEFEEAVTRLIEVETQRVILLGDPAQVPGAWDGTVEELETIIPTRQEHISRALQGSATISGTRAKRLRREMEGQRPFAPKAPVLKGFVPVVIGVQLDYDPLFGIVGD